MQIEEIEAVYWEDLMAECVWQFRFKALGPLTVSIDTRGKNFSLSAQAQARKRLAAMHKKLGLD